MTLKTFLSSPKAEIKIRGHASNWSKIEEQYGYILLKNRNYGDETRLFAVLEDINIKKIKYIQKNSGSVTVPTITPLKIFSTYDKLETTLHDADFLA